MNPRNTVFELNDVSVDFRRLAAKERSLKYTLASFFNNNGDHSIRALNGISLRIYEGDQIGIIGRNGAGKSTLLRVLSRVIIPQKGTVCLHPGKRLVPLAELGIGFQPDLSGRENCYLAGALLGYPSGRIDDMMNEIIEFSELHEFIDEPVKNYSAGMYARLAFTLATDVDPDVLLVDEVFGVGDEFFMQKCQSRMQRLISSGGTTVFVSHNLDFLAEQCNRLIWLDKGVVAKDGDPMEVIYEYRRMEGKY